MSCCNIDINDIEETTDFFCHYEDYGDCIGCSNCVEYYSE